MVMVEEEMVMVGGEKERAGEGMVAVVVEAGARGGGGMGVEATVVGMVEVGMVVEAMVVEAMVVVGMVVAMPEFDD